MTRRVWTAAELEAIAPSDVDAIFEDSIIWDIADAPRDLLARSRERIMRRIDETESTQQTWLIVGRSGPPTASLRTSTVN